MEVSELYLVVVVMGITPSFYFILSEDNIMIIFI